jgi:energy-coupling factor transporter ATP-binding protein EcfA2
MLDTEGHRAVVGLLRDLAASGVAVVHVTHRPLDGEGAGQVLRLTAAPAPRPPGGAGVLRRLRGGKGAAYSPSEPADVKLRGVGHVYALHTPWAHRALTGVDLDISPGEGVVIAGHNGSGKSTLAWVLSGLVVATEGEALVGGVRAAERIGQVGIGFQHARLQMLRPTVLADVSYGSDELRARAALAAVGFDPTAVAGRRVDELSGGEQRRVALAGILARSPVLLVLDEPLAGLDEDTRTTLEQVLALLRSEDGVATVVIAHDLAVAAGLGERLVTLDSGRVVSDGPMPAARPAP